MTSSGSPRQTVDFLISYTRADRAWAEWIAWQLEEAGYHVVIQAWDFFPGRDWVHDVQQALGAAHQVVAVLSPAYLASEHGEAEWRGAFADDPSGERGRLLPVRVGATEVPGMLKSRVYADLVGLDEKAARDELLAAARGRRAKPDVPPAFPGEPPPDHATSAPPFPRALPSIWNVPYQPNPHFAGRGEVLAEIHARLNRPDAKVRRVVLSGLGGVGKTQLAAEYAYRHQHEFDLVWWVRGTLLTTLLSDLAALATQLPLAAGGREAAEAPQPELVAAVRHWLERHPRWLLVLDDAPDAAALADLLPRSAVGQVLVTSREATGWAPLASQVEVDALTPDVAAAFLLERTGSDDLATAHALAVMLGCLPLALEQAAGYLTATGVTLSSYAELVGDRAMELLSRGRPLAYEQTVATTWSLALERLVQSHPAAIALLDLLAYCAADDLPRPLLTSHHHLLPDPLATVAADPIQLGDAVAALRRYSLVRVSGDGLGTHPLVQLVVRDGLTVGQRHGCARAAVDLLLAAFPNPEDVTAWPRCQRLLGHVMAAVRHADHLRLEPAEAIPALMNTAGVYLNLRGEPRQARPLLQDAADRCAQVLGEEHPDTLASKHNLSMSLHGLGEFDEARRLGEQVLASLRRRLGADHPRTLLAMNNLALTLAAQGDPRAARELHERTLAAYRRVLGDEHPDTLRSMSNLAAVLGVLGKLREARALREEGLAIRRRVLGEDQPATLSSMDGLASILRDLGDADQARELFEQVLAARRRVLGDDHPDTLRTMQGLAATLDLLGRLDEARELDEQSLAGFQRVLGDDHPDTLFAASNLATVLHNLGERERARELHEQILSARRRVLGDDHHNTLDSMHNLADSLLAQGRADEARELNEQALAGYRRLLGDLHPDTLHSMNNLGANLARLGELERAQALFEQAWRGYRRLLGDGHPKTVLALRGLMAVAVVRRSRG
jgi:tetratricopeptide (TPR) repeat protein